MLRCCFASGKLFESHDGSRRVFWGVRSRGCRDRRAPWAVRYVRHTMVEAGHPFQSEFEEL